MRIYALFGAVRQAGSPGGFEVDADLQRDGALGSLQAGTKLTCPWGRPKPHQGHRAVRPVRDTIPSPNGHRWLCAGDASFQAPPPPTAGSTTGRPCRRWYSVRTSFPARRWPGGDEYLLVRSPAIGVSSGVYACGGSVRPGHPRMVLRREDQCTVYTKPFQSDS